MTYLQQSCREPRRIFGRKDDRWRWRLTHLALVAVLAMVALASIWQIVDSLASSRTACAGCGTDAASRAVAERPAAAAPTNGPSTVILRR